MEVSIREVKNRRDLNKFVHFPFTLYKHSTYWVPPLNKREYDTLSPRKNPAFRHSEDVLFLTERDHRVCGRIAVIVNHRENQNTAVKEARFGWYDAIDDFEVSDHLLRSAERWAKARGVGRIKGPMGFTNFDKAGLLMDGYDEYPTSATIYNYPYYRAQVTRRGYVKAVDYIEYEIAVPERVPEKVERFSQMISDRYGFELMNCKSRRSLCASNRALFNLINETYKNLYGFVAFDDVSKDYYKKQFLRMLNPDFISIVVDREKKPVAFALTMPSYAGALKKSKGKLFPFGLWHLWKAARHPKRVDLLLIGVKEEFRKKGLPAMLFKDLIETFNQNGVQMVESNPELESNMAVRSLWKNYAPRQHKRRRIYYKDL